MYNIKVFLKRCVVGFLAFSLVFSAFPSFAQTSESSTLLQSNPQGVFVSNQEPSSTAVIPNENTTSSRALARDPDGFSAPPAPPETPAPPPPSYPELMREFRAVQLGKEYDNTPLTDSNREARKAALLSNLVQHAKTELVSLRSLGVSPAKQQAFLSSLNEKIRALGGSPTWWDQIKEFFRDLFGIEEPAMKVIIKEELPKEPFIPEKPSSFSSPTDPPPVQETKSVEIEDQPIPDDPTLQEQLKNLIITQKADADTADLPTLDDLKEDSEIVFASEIRNLASSLDHNPAKIFNFVRNKISFEPYTGSIKGALGCLHEKKCNDTDTASLFIALLRASGIPARYKKSPISASKDQLTALTRTEDLRGAYYALYRGGRDVVLPREAPPMPGGKDWLNKADFSSINTLYLAWWTYVQMFYEYDERGANVSNTLDLSSIDSNQALQQTLASYPKKSWVSLDAAFKPSTHHKKPVLQDFTDFHADAFLIDYLKSNQNHSPLQAYESFLKETTGKDVKDYLSTWTLEQFEISIVPPTLPFLEVQRLEFVRRENDKEPVKIIIYPETWASLLYGQKNKVTIRLTKPGEQSPILSLTLFSSQISAEGIILDYQGFQDADKKVIEKAGGIHNTDASIVDIVPVFSLPTGDKIGNVPVSIGDTLILHFIPYVVDHVFKESQKVSIAGNREGIAITFSPRALQPAHLTTTSSILLAGNVSLAQEYLKTVFQNFDTLAQEFDHQYGINFARAVVTQNRILTKTQQDLPSTFDFNGLFIDAHYEFSSYSSTQDFAAHKDKDFRYLMGMEGSFYEAQTLTDLTGMQAVSTITGLTNALSKPNEYKVFLTLKDENKNTIDTLNLSQTTGEQVRARLSSVPKGCISIAPDKPVSLEAWTGFVFMDINLSEYSSCGFDTYGIGEQVVGNGGFTAGEVKQETWKDAEGVTKTAYENESKSKKTGKIEKYKYLGGAYRDIQCKQETEWFDSIYSGIKAPGWTREKYGEPCIDENPPFVFQKKDNYYYLLTDGGGYFQSDNPSYQYWLSNQAIIDAFKARYPNELITINKLQQKYWGTYRFDHGQGVGMYNPEHKRVYEAQAEMGQAYKGPQLILDQYIPALLGYPTNEQAQAEPFNAYGVEFHGLYQKFTNGTFYTSYSAIPDGIALVFGKMDKEHTFGLGGTGGAGFPEDNPEFSAKEENTVIQDFQKAKRMRHSLATDTVSFETLPIISDQLYNLPQTDNEKTDFTEGMIDAFAEFDLYTAGIVIGAVGFGTVLWKYKGVIIERAIQHGIARASLAVAKKLGVALTLGFLAADIQKFLPIRQACQADPEKFIEGKSVFYYCGKDKVYSTLLFIGLAAPPVQAGKINNYGVVTDVADVAKAVKAKIFSPIKTVSQINGIRKALKNNPLRDDLLSNLNRTNAKGEILDDDVKTVVDSLENLPAYYASHPLGLMRLVLVEDFVKAGKMTRQQKEALEDMHQWVSGRLKGKTFGNFDSLRTAYWKAAAEYSGAKSLFSGVEIAKMENGLAPVYRAVNEKLNLHHLVPRKRDGSLIMELQNLFPIPTSIHKWSHYEENGATLQRFGKLNMPDQ